MQIFELDDGNPALVDLVLKAAAGEPFLVRHNGKTVVQVRALPYLNDQGERRLGGMEGQFVIPEDFDRMCADEIEEMFYGKQ